MPSYVTEAVVVGARRYGEADKLVMLFTETRGRVGAIAKSARKAKSSLRAATEPFVRARFDLASGRSLDIIRQAEIIDAHVGLRENWARLQIAGHVAEIVTSTTEERIPDPELYHLVADTLGAVSRGEQHAVLIFKVRMLEHMGIMPDLSSCAQCGSKGTKGNVHLDVTRHGFICSSCAKSAGVYRPVPMPALYLLHSLKIDGAASDEVDDAAIRIADDSLTALFEGFLQSKLRTSSASRHAFRSETGTEQASSGSEDINTEKCEG